MAKSFFKVQDRLHLLDRDDDVKYTSLIQEVKPPVLIITEPVSITEGGKRLRKGEVWDFELMSGDAIYTFSSEVLGRLNENPPVYRIEHPRSARRRQRREYYRLEIYLDVEYEVIKKGEEDSYVEIDNSELSDAEEQDIVIPEDSQIHISLTNFEAKMKDKTENRENDVKEYGFTVDISGGGLQLLLSRYLPANSEIRMTIFLPDQEEGIMAVGNVIRCFSVQVGMWKKYRAAISFIKIPEKSRDVIIKYIFDNMRKRMK